MRQMMEMDGDWCEERPTLIDSYGWALNPECFYLNLTLNPESFEEGLKVFGTVLF